TFNLLDNCPNDAANVAVVRLFNSNGTIVLGNTIQGHWTGGTGTKPSIVVEQSRGVTLENNWIEAQANTAPGILIKNTKGVSIIGGNGSGGHPVDVEIQGSSGISLINCKYLNPQANIKADTFSNHIAVIGGVLSSSNGIQDSSYEGIDFREVAFHNETNVKTVDITDWGHSNNISTFELLTNGFFTSGTSAWTGAATGITRVATGAPPFDGPYVLCNTQGLAAGPLLGSNNFTQIISIPDSVPANITYCLQFLMYIESVGTGTDATKWIDVEFHGSNFSVAGGT